MTLALALMLSTLTPRTVAQTAPATPAPLPACIHQPRFVAVAIDPLPPIDVNVTQQFVIAMRVVSDAGYSWRLLDAPEKIVAVRPDGNQVLSDVAFTNLTRKAGDPPMVGGESTQLYLFTATSPGSATLNFGLFRPGGATPARTVAYTVRVSPHVAVC